MTDPEVTRDSIADLIAQLDRAVSVGNRDDAALLEQRILKRLAAEFSHLQDVERQVRSLMEALVEPLPVQKSEFSLTGHLRAPASADKPVVYPVWFCTNREAKVSGGGFTGDRCTSVTYGRVDVRVPLAHRRGETGSSFWTHLRRLDFRDDDLRIETLVNQKPLECFEEIRRKIQNARDDQGIPHALIYLHGYRVSFEEAAIRAAQLGCDLEVAGVTAFFSWPSRDRVDAYSADEASIEASEAAITEFLVAFSANCQADKIHLVAHSMGNRGLLRALQRIAGNAETKGKVKFGQIFLAAPDVDRDLFLDLARLYSEHSDRTTLYASHGDLAVDISAKVHDAARAGYFMPYTAAAGIDTIAVPNFNIDLFGHSYYAEAKAMLDDMQVLMQKNLEPCMERNMEPANSNGVDFWRLRG